MAKKKDNSKVLYEIANFGPSRTIPFKGKYYTLNRSGVIRTEDEEFATYLASMAKQFLVKVTKVELKKKENQL